MKLVFVIDDTIKTIMTGVSDVVWDGDVYTFMMDGERHKLSKGKSDIYLLADDDPAETIEQVKEHDRQAHYQKVDPIQHLEEENIALKLALVELDMKVGD